MCVRFLNDASRGLIKAAWHALIGKVIRPVEYPGDEPFSALVVKKPVPPRGDTGVEIPLPANDQTDAL